jgi:hypothetical protein
MVEHSAVNRRVASSNLARGANLFNNCEDCAEDIEVNGPDDVTVEDKFRSGSRYSMVIDSCRDM